MDAILSFIAPLILVILGYTVGSVKIISEGNQALVERLGKYNRTLNPGFNSIIPLVETIVAQDTTREQILDITPQEAISKDNVSLKANAVIYWQILDLEKAFYAIDDVDNAIKNLVLTTLRSKLGQMPLEQAFSARKEINLALLQDLDEATAAWGVKVTRVEVLDIMPAPKVLESMEQERAAEIKKRAAILDAEGTAEYMKRISDVLRSQPNAKEVLQFFLAQKYVEANYKLGESQNSKVVFMDPKAMTDALAELMSSQPEGSNHNSGSNGSNPTRPTP